MKLAAENFRRDEQVSLQLRGLFERRGFRRVRVNKFEDYALYVDNKNFLQSESVITFMDVNGKLLALKPDVTLSVVRGMPKKELPALEKLYYVDEVYRLSPENREYKVRSQIGVEMIGGLGDFSNIEAVDLALASLAVIGERFILDISHLGFVSGLLDHMGLSHTARSRILAAIHAKSPHDIVAALDLDDVQDENRKRVVALCDLHGGFFETLPRAQELIVCEQMAQAHAELARLAASLRQNPFAKNMNLDFSVVNDLDYYNGLIFLGYAEGLPKEVLTGGRYDNLMRKMGKQNGAVGFAVSLDELDTYSADSRAGRFDFDVLVTYGVCDDYAQLLSQAQAIREQGKSVRLESETSVLSAAGFTWEKHLRFENGKLTEA